jgi:hypothetical protein
VTAHNISRAESMYRRVRIGIHVELCENLVPYSVSAHVRFLNSDEYSPIRLGLPQNNHQPGPIKRLKSKFCER